MNIHLSTLTPEGHFVVTKETILDNKIVATIDQAGRILVMSCHNHRPGKTIYQFNSLFLPYSGYAQCESPYEAIREMQTKHYVVETQCFDTNEEFSAWLASKVKPATTPPPA